MSGPSEVVAHARSMIGTRWRHQGRKPWAVDCLGLVVLSLQSAGWRHEMSIPARYGREPWDDRLRRGLREHLGEPVQAPWQAGDIALIRWNRGEPSHVGILGDYVYGDLSIIHASTREGVIETGLSGELLDGIVEVYRPVWGET